jgi:hypothetical protein
MAGYNKDGLRDLVTSCSIIAQESACEFSKSRLQHDNKFNLTRKY